MNNYKDQDLDRAYADGKEDFARKLAGFLDSYQWDGECIEVDDVLAFIEDELAFDPDFSDDDVEDALLDAELEARLSHDY